MSSFASRAKRHTGALRSAQTLGLTITTVRCYGRVLRPLLRFHSPMRNVFNTGDQMLALA